MFKRSRKLLAMLLGNNQGIPLSQFLKYGAPFLSELTHTAVPQRAAPGTTATFTRATTATFTDHEGVLRTAIAGEARFVGARRVRNLIPSSESFATGWTAPGAASVSANAMLSPIGTLTADALIEDGTTAYHRINHASVTRTSGQVIAVSVHAKYAGRNLFMNWNAFCNAAGAFNLQTGEVTQGEGVASIEALDGGWYRCTVIGTCTATGADNGYLQLTPTNVSGSYAGDGVSGAYFWGVQLEDITGRADQTTPSEYVSVGVESAPAYHGAGVDGVKYFDTTLAGVPISSSTLKGYLSEGSRQNICLQSNSFNTTWTENGGVLTCTQNVTGPDGATSAWTMTDDSAAAIEGRAQAITLTAATYTFSVFVKKTASATTFPAIYAIAGSIFAGATIDTNNGTATAIASFDALTMASGISVRCSSYNTDFWRAELTFTGTAASWTHLISPAAATAGNQSAYTSAAAQAVTGSAVIYGAQVELGSFASTYIPTTTVAVTRNIDSLTYVKAGNLSDTQGALALEGFRSGHTGFNSVFAGNASGGEYMIASNTALTGAPQAKSFDGTNNPTKGGTGIDGGVLHKYAVNWTTGALSITLDGLSPASTNYDGTWSSGAIKIGGDDNQFFGTIRNVRIWQVALSSSQLQAITA